MPYRDLRKLIESDLPEGIRRIAIKMSGGVDSSLLALILAEIAVIHEPRFELTPIVIVEESSPFQKEFVDRIIEFVEERTDFKFSSIETFFLSTKENKIEKMREIENSLLETGKIELILSGVTRQPEDKAFLNGDGPEEDRSHEQPRFWPGPIYTPFVNYNKKVLSDYYLSHNLMDSLFRLTRSCTAQTLDFSNHCGACWWCRERRWAFGTL